MSDLIPDRLIAEKPFSSWELVVRDSFDLKELYIRLHDFLIDEEFTDLTTAKGDPLKNNNYETFYREIDNGDGTKDHKIWWRASRFAKDNNHNNIKFYLQIDMKTVRMEKKEFVVNGQKVKLDKGEFEVKFSLFLDYHNNRVDVHDYENHFILKHLKNLFQNKWNRVPTDLAMAEAMTFSNDLYSLIQVYTGVRPNNPTTRQDYLSGRGLH